MNNAGGIHQKIPTTRSAPAFVKQRVLDEIKKRGYALPCHLVAVNGPLVTVAFDLADINLPQVTIPTYGSQYQRQPYQRGDGGFTFPLAVDISAAAGLGTGLPTMDVPANLSSLYWLPGSSADFSPAEDPNAHILIGPNGVILRDINSQVVLKVHPTQGVVISFAGLTWTFNANGFTDSNGIVEETHAHPIGTYTAPDGPLTGGEAGPPQNP